METRNTGYGGLVVAAREVLFEQLAGAINGTASAGGGCTVALTGGSTPKAWYPWAVETGALSEAARERVLWTVSDERHVAPESDESNFGNAARLLLDPLGISAGRRLPWPVERPPGDAAAAYGRAWAERRGAGAAYDLCVLGMGDDCHTASLFPGSPLLGERDASFAAVEVPGKGWRLTVTPAGLRRCGRILVIVTGAGKAEALKAVMHGPRDSLARPVQVLADMADRVTWMVDPEAAELAFGGDART